MNKNLIKQNKNNEIGVCLPWNGVCYLRLVYAASNGNTIKTRKLNDWKIKNGMMNKQIKINKLLEFNVLE